MGISPFVLYGLVGCPHCVEAEEYLQKAGIPFTTLVSNNDPIADAGIKTVTGKEIPQYPVLLYKITKELIVGYKPEEYERLVKSFYSLIRTNTGSVFDSGQSTVQATPQSDSTS